MGIKSIQKILLIIVVVGFVFAFLSPILFKGLDWDTRQPLESLYGIINWGLPVAVILLVSVSLFSTQGYKNVQSAGSTLKKIADFIFRLILIAITAIVSWIVLVFIGFSNGSYSMSTYGTPIHRPRIK